MNTLNKISKATTDCTALKTEGDIGFDGLMV